MANIAVVEFDALLMKFAEAQGASMIIRGLRAVADFEYEYQMAGMNQQLNSRIETVFLMADVALQPIASRLVKEIADLRRRRPQVRDAAHRRRYRCAGRREYGCEMTFSLASAARNQ